MIFKKHLSYLDNFTVDVDVYGNSGKKIGKGKLTIKDNFQPKVSLTNLIHKIDNGSSAYFTCKTDNQTYQLIDCQIHHDLIFPKFIIKGSQKRLKFKKFDLLLQGVTQWFNLGNHTIIDKDKVTITRKTDLFNVDIQHNEITFNLSNEYWCDQENISQNSTKINEYTALTISSRNKTFSIEDLTSLVNQIRIFFTLLIGHPIGIIYILDQTSKHKAQSIYFSNHSKKSYANLKPIDCFVNSKSLFIANKWPDILKGFFNQNNDKVYRKLWGRIAGLLAYEGFWEYEILAYVSLLDRYVTIDTENTKLSLSENQFIKFNREARRTLNAIECPPTLEPDKFNKVIESMCIQIRDGVQNSSIPSFGEKFNLRLKKTNPEIIKVLNLDKSEFKHIKLLRNQIAHGDEPKTINTEDLNYESRIKNKIALLLRYWVFMRIGFSNTDFLNYLNNWCYPITRNAEIDQQELDIALGKHHFLETNITNFKKAKKLQSKWLVLKFIKSSKTFQVDTQATNQLNKSRLNMKRSKSKSILEELTKVVDTTKIKNAMYLTSVYIKHNDQQFKTYSVYILNCPEYIYKDNTNSYNFKKFDSITSSWISL